MIQISAIKRTTRLRIAIHLLMVSLLAAACVRVAAPQLKPIPPATQLPTLADMLDPLPSPAIPTDISSFTPTLPPTNSPLPLSTPIIDIPAISGEVPVTILPLQGPLASSEAEISGMAWYRNYLILLPQFPKRMSPKADGAIFAIPREQITGFLDGKRKGPLNPLEIPFVSSGVEKVIGGGFEGFEAIDFLDEQAFLAIEVNRGDSMMGYLVSGHIAPDLSEFRLDPTSLARNPPQVNIGNLSDEALLVVGNRIFTLYEANGARVNRAPAAHMFDFLFNPEGTLAFPQIEYRITDATELDEQGRFWVINFNFSGDKILQTEQDPLAVEYGEGPSHAKSQNVERLVELQLGHDGITLSGEPPLQLQLLGDIAPRNWEGLVRLEQRGFLLVTDKYPMTFLGFVPLP